MTRAAPRLRLLLFAGAHDRGVTRLTPVQPSG
jgi:hypothetical protein